LSEQTTQQTIYVIFLQCLIPTDLAISFIAEVLNWG